MRRKIEFGNILLYSKNILNFFVERLDFPPKSWYTVGVFETDTDYERSRALLHPPGLRFLRVHITNGGTRNEHRYS